MKCETSITAVLDFKQERLSPSTTARLTSGCLPCCQKRRLLKFSIMRAKTPANQNADTNNFHM